MKVEPCNGMSVLTERGVDENALSLYCVEGTVSRQMFGSQEASSQQNPAMVALSSQASSTGRNKCPFKPLSMVFCCIAQAKTGTKIQMESS